MVKLIDIVESIIYTDLKKKRLSDTAAKVLVKYMEEYKPLIAVDSFKSYLYSKYKQVLTDDTIESICKEIWNNSKKPYSRLKQIAKDLIYKNLKTK